MHREKIFPFTAIVGQEDMKLSLILNSIYPSLGGVLIQGEKGTCKSTTVRAFAALLPEREETDCMFHCDPYEVSLMCDECRKKFDKGEGFEISKNKMRVIDLPLSTTEDRLVGSLSIEEAMRGKKKFEAGILASANRNILYVDEVNLLEDHLVDMLLDVAAMGVNIVEREGISYSHPSRFILVGTMNPEEGDLRPQLSDRFGLSVRIFSEKDPEMRVEIIKRRLEYEENPEAFLDKWEDEEEKEREKIKSARKLLPNVKIGEREIMIAANIGITLNLAGHRGDIAIIKTALANAAYRGSDKVEEEDLIKAASLVLPHRLKTRPFEEKEFDFSKIEELVNVGL